MGNLLGVSKPPNFCGLTILQKRSYSLLGSVSRLGVCSALHRLPFRTLPISVLFQLISWNCKPMVVFLQQYSTWMTKGVFGSGCISMGSTANKGFSFSNITWHSIVHSRGWLGLGFPSPYSRIVMGSTIWANDEMNWW